MAIIYPLTFPTVGGIASVKIIPKDINSETESEFSLNQNVFGHLGQGWGIIITSVPLARAQADEWIAFLLALKGIIGTFLFGDPFNTVPRGVGTGTPVIAGGSQTGEDINTSGWTASTGGILLKNDWLQISSGAASKIYKQLVDLNSDAGGLATLTLYPNVKTAFADLTSITVTSPKGLWRLMSNDRPWTPTPDGLYTFSFAAKQVQ